jgi:hypothetical protein
MPPSRADGLLLLASYALALILWLVIIACDLLLRAAFLPFIPFLWARSLQSQPNAQMLAGAMDFYTRPFMRMPKLPLRRRRPADYLPHTSLVEEIRDRRV